VNETKSTCPYCGVGCGVIIESVGPQITGVRGDPDHPANFGRLCSKGQMLHLTATPAVLQHERALNPQHRAARGEPLRPLAWDRALDLAAERIAAAVQARGPDAVGFYLSGQLLTEDYAVFNKLARALVGTNNVDTNSRLCMSSAVAGYKQSLGADAPPACYDDIAHAGCLFIAGANTAWAHPVLFRRIEDARRANPQQKLIVIDPRRTQTADEADLFLQIQPGTDVALFHAMLHVMVWEGWLDEAHIAAHTGGFGGLKALVAQWSPRDAARVCGVAADDIVTAARWFALGGGEGDAARRLPTLSMYCQGLNQSSSGTAKNSALINLHLACGQIGRAGAGPLSLTGPPKAMGGREVGGLANALPGHRDPANAEHRAEVAAVWGVDTLPDRPGHTAVAMFEAAARGEVDVLWIACTNPAQSLPDQALVQAALARCPFVIVQEAFAHTATARAADLLLPASTWGEKDGTVTNSERRISRVRAAVQAPGEARADWAIAAQVAQRLETKLRPGRSSLFGYAGAEAVWNEHRELTRGRDLDITGLDWALLDQGPQQWPLAQGATLGTARLYEDGRYVTPDGRARFIAAPYKPVAEPCDARHPYALNTGRLRDQWHAMSRSGTVARLFAHSPQPRVRLHPQELDRRGWPEGTLVELKSRRGALVLPVAADDGVAPMQAFVAMHWGPEFVAGGGVNTLTQGDRRCAQSQQPELKHSAVAITAADLPWRLLARGWFGNPGAAVAARERLRGLFGEFGYASCVPVAGADDALGLMFDAAAAQAPRPELVAEIEALLGLEGPWVLRYADARRGERRSVRLVGDGAEARVHSLLLAGAAGRAGWLARWWAEGLAIGTQARALLAPDPPAPAGAAAARGRQVCNCFDVDEPHIRAVLAQTGGPAAERLAALQGALRCGTQCGSCLPELRRLVAAVVPAGEAVAA
jgi:assimilatory nitrate reductase catalytic subunit